MMEAAHFNEFITRWIAGFMRQHPNDKNKAHSELGKGSWVPPFLIPPYGNILDADNDVVAGWTWAKDQNLDQNP